MRSWRGFGQVVAFLFFVAVLVLLTGCVVRPMSSDVYDGPLVRDDGTPVEAPSW